MFGILVFGDSISFGVGENPNIGWVGRLKKYFEPKGFHNYVFNLAVPGETSTTLLKRFESEIKSRVKYLHPKDKFIVMLAIGINDSRRIGTIDKVQTNPKIFEKNIIKLIKISKKYTKQILIVGLTPVDKDITAPFEDTYFTNNQIQEYDKILKKSALKNKIDYVNLFNPIFESNYKKLLADGLHPNKKGYGKMHRIVKEFLITKKFIE